MMRSPVLRNLVVVAMTLLCSLLACANCKTCAQANDEADRNCQLSMGMGSKASGFGCDDSGGCAMTAYEGGCTDPGGGPTRIPKDETSGF